MEFFNTFGGNPVSCSIGTEVLRFVKREKLQENSKYIGNYLKGELKKLSNKFKIIGRISMDSFTVDISKSSHDLNIGMYLDIINDEHKIDKFAKLCKTIPNEIMTSIGKRVYRKYE